MKLVNTLPFGNKLQVLTNTKGEEYVLQYYVVDGYFLIPFVPHWNSNESTFNPLYWEPHYAKRDSWIPIDKVNFNEWDITPEEFKLIQQNDNKVCNEILNKFHNSF